MLVRSVTKTPARMVETGGRIHFGTFDTPFTKANLLDAPLYALPAPRFWKNFRLKEWQHYGVITPSHYFGMVIFDAKFTALSFFYLYDRQSKTRLEYARQIFPGKAVRVAADMYDDLCRFDAEGYRLRFENALGRGRHTLVVDIRGGASRPAVRGEITVFEDLDVFAPLVQVSPITPRRPFYTHKAAMPAAGLVQVGSREIVLRRTDCVALIDEQKTYYPYRSFWKWATAAGFSPDGKLWGFNLCRNLIADDEDANENCFWMDGRLVPLKAARFEFGDVMKPWRVKTTDGRLEVLFEPLGERAGKVNTAGIIRSDFHQPFGIYSGRFAGGGAVGQTFSNLFGLAEHHVTRY
jgi:hypothetical protein